MRNLIRSVLIAALLVAPAACASTTSVQNAPLHAGTSRTFDADYDRTLTAAREAMLEAGLTMESANEVDDDTWIIVSKSGTSAFSWGERVRVAVVREAPAKTRVSVFTQRKLATNITAKGDYANSILSNVELKLRR